MKKDEIKERIISRCEKNNLTFPSMDAQTALYELCDYFLGEDYTIDLSLGINQCNAQIVYVIETNYKGKE